MEIAELDLQELLEILGKFDIGLIVTVVTSIVGILKSRRLIFAKIKGRKYKKIINNIILV